MKYISRWAALLLAVVMTITSAGAELSVDGLTQTQLDALYQTAAETEIAAEDVLGATAELWSADIQTWADNGYGLQWYVMDDTGAITALEGQNAVSLDITYTLAPQRFVCIAMDSTGKEYISPTFVAQAQTSDMEGYLNYLYEPQFWNEDGTPNARAIYNHLNTVWNVDMDGVSLARSVVEAWWAERREAWFDYQLLCSCVITGAAEADFCMLHPYAEHVGTCGWYTMVDVVEDEATGITVSGDLPAGVSLQVTAAIGKMPEIDTSHVDITATSPMVRSYNITLLDENGDKYILPEGTTVQVTIPNVWSDWMSNPIVDVYHVTDAGEVIYLTSTKGEVVLLEDHSISFETDGFSDFAVLVGIRKHDAVANGGVLDIPMAPGTVVKIGEYWQSYVGCESTAPGVVDVIYSNKYYCISVAEDAPIGTTATVTIQFSEWDGTKTATVNVTVVDEEWPTTIDNVVSVGATTTSTYFPDFSIARYQMAPDTTAIVACGSSNFIAESSNANAVIATVQGNSIYINATSGATRGDTAKVYIRDKDNRILKSIVLIDIIDEQKPTQANRTITAGSHNAGTVGNQNSEMVRYFKMAPDTSVTVTCPTTNIDDATIGLRAMDDNVAFTRNEGTFYITTATNAVAGSTAKLVVRDKTTQAVVMVVFIDIIDESEDIAYTNTYAVDRGDAETYTYDDNSSNVYKYNLAPGMTASAKGYGDVEFTVADTNVALVTSENGVLKVTADANAEIGKTTKIVVKDKTTKAVVTTIFVEIVKAYTPPTAADKLEHGDYPVQLAIRNNGVLPPEPWIYGSAPYTYFDDVATTPDGNITLKVGSSADTIALTAENIIDKTILDHEKFTLIYPDGADVIGLVDPTGKEILPFISGIDWNAMLDLIVAEHEREGTEVTELTASDGKDVTSANKGDYKVIPYVVKCQETDGQGWHIDCVIVGKDVVHLSYDINIPDGMIITTQNIVLPNNETGASGATFTVGQIVDSNTNAAIRELDVAPEYKFTFVEWNTKEDGTGDPYNPSDTTKPITEDTTLYAIWSITPEIGTGSLRVRKVVQDDNATGNETFDFSISIPDANEDGYDYTLYGADNVAVKGDDEKPVTGKVKNGDTLTLKNGQYVIIKSLPINKTITVTETEPGEYAPSWSGGTANGAAVNVEIKDGRLSEVTCTNSKAASTTTLTVKKTGLRDGESAIIKVEVNGKTYMLSLSNTHDSDTIVNLPVGANYTVTELNAWTWQYAENTQPVTGNTVAGGSTVTISNTQKTGNWMHDESSVINDLDGTTVEEIQTPINNQ